MDLSSPRLLHIAFLHAVIIILYALSTISCGSNWTLERSAFIEHGNDYYSVFTTLIGHGTRWRGYILASAIAGGISTLLVDITIIWRCWTLWDRQCSVVFLPIFCAVAGTVMRTMEMLSIFDNSTNNISTAEIDWSLIYVSLTLATTLMCTLLIIYRIIRRASGTNTSHKIVEMLIESSAMYSLSLIIYLALISKNFEFGDYADIIAAYVKVISPTLLVGRVSAHANAVSRREKMVAMWENHPPLVGCFREEGTHNSHSPYGGHQTVSGSSMGNETV
ncbi:hypothetical protein ARMSODRAFT_1089119 [Armillaria solidipes]|uniref:Uncharacterized protein n=1 Tax=Armillaria solidipes TaxID=1076256 RepID=A0A2H3AUX7_9AGAR|nr:hypothetical protein ARMSODRAFT_1089119 [Armillaria solidipes]